MLYRAEEVTDYVDGFAAVSARELAMYDRRGFLVIRGGLSPAEVEAAKADLEWMTLADNPQCKEIYYEGALQDHLRKLRGDAAAKGDAAGASASAAGGLPDLEPGKRAQFVRKFLGFVEQHPALAATAFKPELLRLLAQIAGEPVELFQDMALIKPAGGREKPWHQDHAYFNYPLETKIVGVWIALGTVTPENGCMFVIAGGHRDGPRIHFKRRDWQICDADIMPKRQMAVPMEAGDIMLFDAKLPHGTPMNRTSQYRWALQYHYRPRNARPVDDSVRLSVFGSEGKDVTC